MGSELYLSSADIIPHLAVHYFACESVVPLCDTIVLLHGWGCDSESWQPLMPMLKKLSAVIAIDLPGFGASEVVEVLSLEIILASLAKQLPHKAVLIGWSLGGMLAVQLAARYPEKITRVLTLAANAKFVASHDYSAAMSETINCQFNNSFAKNSMVALKLFSGLLAQGDVNERGLLKKMRALEKPERINHNWLQLLTLLSAIDNRSALISLSQPGLHLYAVGDALVPVSAAAEICDLNSSQSIRIIPDAAHAMHWSQPELIIKTIREFLIATPLLTIDKKKMAQSFSRAAKTYDSVADLQRRVGDALLALVDVDPVVDVVVDLGCGTGYLTKSLQEQFPSATVIGLDIAEGMLQFARNRHAGKYCWMGADAESLPFADASIDIIYSNFSLQWCERIPILFAELSRVLKVGGRLIFSSLGPETLHELKSAWKLVDDYVHVNSFHDEAVLRAALQQNQFLIQLFDRKAQLLEFEKLTDLTRNLKALGAHNVNQGRALGLQGRKTMAAFKAGYENFRQHGFLPATYDVYSVLATKMHEN